MRGGALADSAPKRSSRPHQPAQSISRSSELSSTFRPPAPIPCVPSGARGRARCVLNHRLLLSYTHQEEKRARFSHIGLN